MLVRSARSTVGQGVRDQLGPSWSQLGQNDDQLGQVGRHFAVFRLLRKALLTKLDQVGPVLFPTVFRARENVRPVGGPENYLC